MFSAEESKKVREEFWTSFGKEFTRKWILYDTKIKELELKFTFNQRFAQVSMDIISKDELIRQYYFEKLESMEKILKTEYLPDSVFDSSYELPEGKTISRIYIQLNNVTIHNKKDWPQVKLFLQDNISKLEGFFVDFCDFIKT